MNNNNQVLDFINSVKFKVKKSFIQLLDANPPSCSLLHEALKYTVLSDGKRLRAALIYSLANGQDNILLDQSALAVELIHTYSLVHDDLPAMDNDDLRRGQPSCHIKFDEATAILVGDCLQSMAFGSLSSIDASLLNHHQIESSKLLKVITILSHAIGHQGMVAGQSIELNQSNTPLDASQQLEQLNKIHYFKTGRLITACLQIAAIIANFDQEQYQIITELGDKLGLAFQIQDDLLDICQTPEVLGKPAKSDEKRGLPTYASIVSDVEGNQILMNLWLNCQKLIKALEDSTQTAYPLLSQLLEHIAERQH